MAALCFTCNASPLFELARVFVRFDHGASPHRKRESAEALQAHPER